MVASLEHAGLDAMLAVGFSSSLDSYDTECLDAPGPHLMSHALLNIRLCLLYNTHLQP